MPTLSVDSFKQGLDRRRLAAVSSADRLQEATNVYVNKGGQIVRRPPLIFDTALSAQLHGLAPAGGKLHFFHDRLGDPPPNPDATRFTLHELAITGKTLAAILYAAPFWLAAGTKLYVAALYTDGTIAHWTAAVDGSAAERVTSTNCPHSAGVQIAASRIFAVDGAVVRYSKVGNPTDWSGSDDAGFLPVGRAAGGRDDATALALYDDKLVVFFPDALQVWQVDEDPAQMGLIQHIAGTGTRCPRAVAQIGGHTIFLTGDGYRLIDTQRESQRIIVREVGSPIDALVQMSSLLSPDAAASTGHPGSTAVFSESFDQFLCFRGLATVGRLQLLEAGQALGVERLRARRAGARRGRHGREAVPARARRRGALPAGAFAAGGPCLARRLRGGPGGHEPCHQQPRRREARLQGAGFRPVEGI